MLSSQLSSVFVIPDLTRKRDMFLMSKLINSHKEMAREDSEMVRLEEEGARAAAGVSGAKAAMPGSASEASWAAVASAAARGGDGAAEEVVGVVVTRAAGGGSWTATSVSAGRPVSPGSGLVRRLGERPAESVPAALALSISSAASEAVRAAGVSVLECIRIRVGV